MIKELVSGFFQYVSISAGRSFVNQVISLSAMLVARLRQHNPIDKIGQINRCKDRVSELNGSFDYLSNGLELAGNNVRLKILFLLYEEKQLCVCDLSDILGMTISAISQHLRKLKDRKLIETERQAQTIFYSLTKEYGKMLKPFFKILHENKILESI